MGQSALRWTLATAALLAASVAEAALPVVANPSFEEGDPRWREERLRFVAPDDCDEKPARLALFEWQLEGALDFDRVELYPVKLSHRAVGRGEMGEGERVAGPDYQFVAPLGTWRSVSHPLAGYTAQFHEDRWRFIEDGQYLIYRHRIAGRRQATATVKPGVWFHEPSSLRLRVEASTDGQTYQTLGEVRHGAGGSSFPVPATMLPADEVWVRMSCDAADRTQPTFFQVNGYEYAAVLEGPGPDGVGQTAALTVMGEDATLTVEPRSIARDEPTLDLEVTNRGAEAAALAPVLTVTDPQGETKETRSPVATVPPGGTTQVSVPYATPGPGRYTLELALGSDLRTRLATDATVCVLDVSGYGESLPSPDPGIAVWWATSGWKVSRTRPAPAAAGDAVVIRLAANEAEGAQIVVRPERELRGLTAAAGELRNAAGDVLPPGAVELLAVDYVQVDYVSDEFGRTGLWPDPLPPLGEGRDVPAGSNQPIWVNVKAPANARPYPPKGGDGDAARSGARRPGHQPALGGPAGRGGGLRVPGDAEAAAGAEGRRSDARRVCALRGPASGPFRVENAVGQHGQRARAAPAPGSRAHQLRSRSGPSYPYVRTWMLLFCPRPSSTSTRWSSCSWSFGTQM
jgi:hypothetical protein